MAAIPWRPISLLAFASFAGSANLRISDALLALIAADLGVSVGTGAWIIATFAIAYGLMQAFYGPIADRGVSKIGIVAVCSILAGLATGAAALTGSLVELSLMRLLAGALVAAVIPIAFAWLGDAVAYEQRQAVLARFLSGQTLGLVAGQAAGGIIGDLLGWRPAFLLLGATHIVAGLALLGELRRPEALAVAHGAGGPGAVRVPVLAATRDLLSRPWVRIVLIAVGIEGAAMYGAFAYVGADLHQRLGLSFTVVGAMLGLIGVGGLIYAWTAKYLLRWLTRPTFAIAGGLLMAVAYGALALKPSAWVAALVILLLGFAFFLLHNTLQVEATQMAPEARGLAIALFAASLFLCQSAGVAIAGFVVDSLGPKPVYAAAAVMLAGVGVWFGAKLRGGSRP